MGVATNLLRTGQCRKYRTVVLICQVVVFQRDQRESADDVNRGRIFAGYKLNRTIGNCPKTPKGSNDSSIDGGAHSTPKGCQRRQIYVIPSGFEGLFAVFRILSSLRD